MRASGVNGENRNRRSVFCATSAALRLFVRRELFDEDQAAEMLAWPPSLVHVHPVVWIPEDNRLREAPRALLRTESRGARAADV